jgi:hypothetical protein
MGAKERYTMTITAYATSHFLITIASDRSNPGSTIIGTAKIGVEVHLLSGWRTSK